MASGRNSRSAYGCALALLLAGCGGTTTDTTTPYNRGNAPVGTSAPGGTNAAAASPNELASTSLFLNASTIDDKRVESVVQALQKLPNPPQRIFLVGMKSSTAKTWSKYLKAVRAELLPVASGEKSTDWAKAIKLLDTKRFGNGPSEANPNVDGVTDDQSLLSSTITLDGVMFLVMHTETPTTYPGDKKARVPLKWLSQQLDGVEKNKAISHIVSIGARLPENLANSKSLPLAERVTKALEAEKKLRLVVGLGEQTKVEKPEAGLTKLTLGAPSKDDEPWIAGVLEVYRSGKLRTYTTKLNADGKEERAGELVLFEPAPKVDGKSKASDAKPVDAKPDRGSKEPEKSGPKPDKSAG